MSERHTPSSLADVLERDYFPMPGGAKLYLSEYEWRMVVTALRSTEADSDALETLWGALGDLTREAAKHISKGEDGYAFLAHAQDLLKRRNAPLESK